MTTVRRKLLTYSLWSVCVDGMRKDCYDILDKKLQGRVKFPIGGIPRKP